MLKIFKKNKEQIPFEWLCSKRKCEKFGKELVNILDTSTSDISEDSINEFKRRLKKCNECFLKNKAIHTTVKKTRWTLSTIVHYYKSSKSKQKN